MHKCTPLNMSKKSKKHVNLAVLRRKREVTLAGAYEFDGIDSVQGIKRILGNSNAGHAGNGNSLSRNRTLAYLALASIKVLEVGAHEERIAALEQAVHSRNVKSEISVFEVEPKHLER